jgi:aminopeptidase-like protein
MLKIDDLLSSIELEVVGRDIYRLIKELYPFCRSITGDGVRLTLDILKQHIPLELHEIPSGKEVFDWTIPREWNIKDAYVKNSKGERIIDFQKSNLHVVSYSVPIKRKLSLEELKEYLHTLPDHPDWIPYRTSYYKETWGFCLSHNQFLNLEDGEYEVFIDSSLKEGHLTYGEYCIKGETSDEVLISCHTCHPSLCNDNLSGVALSAILGKYMKALSLRYSYRILFIPGTVGSIAWLYANENRVPRIKHGMVLACLGDRGKSTYKRSRRGNAEIDQAAAHVLKHFRGDYEVIDFFPYGYDERQYCSPGFNLPVGCLMRTPHGGYPEYHTSADNLDFVRPESLADSFVKCVGVLHVLENNRKYLNLNPKCEPQLGKRGLYGSIGGYRDLERTRLAMFWVLNLSDGDHTLLEIAKRADMEFRLIHDAAEALREKGLLKELEA